MFLISWPLFVTETLEKNEDKDRQTDRKTDKNEGDSFCALKKWFHGEKCSLRIQNRKI